MHIWVDADACPVAIKKILFKAVARTGIELTLVANHYLSLPIRLPIHFIRVPAGSDRADMEIMDKLSAGDLVITADIPLAALVLQKGGMALSPYGELFSTETIGMRLSMRNFMESLRNLGIKTEGPKPLSQKMRETFANQLYRILADGSPQ